tara:strand:- start:677 stop:793 length:117 start_codon:yes stop_codon:yes gene_type:complete
MKAGHRIMKIRENSQKRRRKKKKSKNIVKVKGISMWRR